MESYITVTAPFIKADWHPAFHVLQTRAMYEGHTSANMAQFLQEVAEEWHLTIRDVVSVTDVTPNMVVAAQLGK